MAVAFISDIHSNIDALDSALEAAAGCEIICLGDVVGYGACPNEVVGRLMEVGAKAVMGNHDSVVLTGDFGMFNPRAAVAAAWTARQLTPESRKFLASLPREVRTEVDGVRTYLTHGSPDDNLWEYVDISTHELLLEHYLTKLGVGLVGLGHTHIPYVWKCAKGTVFNPGSVGQPRDGDRRASLAVAKVVNGMVEVENRRVEYDYAAAARRITEAGLPESLAERLFRGT